MTEDKEIQGAIDKLAYFRDASAPGPWQYGYDVIWDGNGHTMVTTNDWGATPNHVALIVILRETIDAQLALLELAIEYGALPEGSGSRFASLALNLARAINGTKAS